MIAGSCARRSPRLGRKYRLGLVRPAWRLQPSALPVIQAILLGELLSGFYFGDLPGL